MKRIAIYNAKPEMVVAKEIYSRNGRLLLRNGEVLTKNWIDKLIDFGVPTIYVEGEPSANEISQESQLKPHSHVLKKKAYYGDVPDMVSPEIREDAENAVLEAIQDVKSGNLINISTVRQNVENIVSQLINNSNIIGKLADIRILDDYTLAHSVNVCIMSISTGILLGYSKIRLRELGVGALLHDIGKVKVPAEIINRTGPLTDKEFQEVKKHTLYGHEILSQHPDITANSARIALQHHECFNGSGYPSGVKSDEIHEYSKIVAIADVYDALTADRVYKNAILPYEAMEVIIASSGYQFDPKILKIFVENSEIYPVGSTVELSTGEIGIVVNVNRALSTRPTVKLVADAEGDEITEDVQIDLMKNTTVFVKRILSFRKRLGL